MYHIPGTCKRRNCKQKCMSRYAESVGGACARVATLPCPLSADRYCTCTTRPFHTKSKMAHTLPMLHGKPPANSVFAFPLVVLCCCFVFPKSTASTRGGIVKPSTCYTTCMLYIYTTYYQRAQVLPKQCKQPRVSSMQLQGKACNPRFATRMQYYSNCSGEGGHATSELYFDSNSCMTTNKHSV